MIVPWIGVPKLVDVTALQLQDKSMNSSALDLWACSRHQDQFVHPGQRKHSVNKLYFLVQTRASNNLEGAWLILVPGQWESTWSLAELFQLFLLGRMGTASSFPGGFFFFAEKSLFSCCLHFASLSCWIQRAGGEDAPPPQTGPTGRGERFPLKVQFFPITFVLPCFFYKTSSKCFYHKLGYILQYKWSI